MAAPTILSNPPTLILASTCPYLSKLVSCRPNIDLVGISCVILGAFGSPDGGEEQLPHSPRS